MDDERELGSAGLERELQKAPAVEEGARGGTGPVEAEPAPVWWLDSERKQGKSDVP
jgi:hypothetical protein